MAAYTKAQVKKAIKSVREKNKSYIALAHANHIEQGWKEGKSDMELQTSYDVVCDNS